MSNATVFHRKDRVSVRGRVGTLDYWCPSMAHVAFDDDPKSIAVVSGSDLDELVKIASER